LGVTRALRGGSFASVKIRRRTYPSGKVAWQLDLGMVEKQREQK
jgi:hypothetical protein